MASEDRRGDPGLARSLIEAPQRFDFFQAVRLRRQMTAGTTVGDVSDVVRFRTRLSLEFPASAIHDLRWFTDDGASRPPEMTVSFMGLTGPSGVLPRHYTELLIERAVRYKDHTAHAFFDLFNHRLIALFYQAWEKYHFFVAYERGDRETFTRYILDLVGLGTNGLQNRLREGDQGMPDQALGYYGGLTAQRPHGATALAAILRDYFGTEVEVEQCRGRWLVIAPSDRTRLGLVHCALGNGAVLGHRVWDRQSSFRVRLGPLPKAQFDQLLPNGMAFLALVRFVRFFVGPALDFDIQLVLRREDVPDCRLGAGPEGPRLGWSTWLKTAPLAEHADDAILSVRSEA
jgi:type VI secretion system protein ImpH